MKMVAREVAWRVFAGEYNNSTHVEAGTDERSPSYVVTPLGARINRLFVVGVLTDIENIGTDAEPMWRARVSDPTGVFYISAGQYQPEAAAALSKIKPPKFVVVVGKSRTYSPEEGVMYVSIRPETIKEVNSELRDYWVLDACKSLRKRLDVMWEVSQMETPTLESVMALGAGRNLAEGMMSALDHYGYIDVSRFQSMLKDSLRYLLPEYQGEEGQSGITDLEEPQEDSETDLENEEILLEIVGTLDTDVKGASWDDIVRAAEKKGIGRMQIEEATNSLLDKGLIYEPVLGRIKKI